MMLPMPAGHFRWLAHDEERMLNLHEYFMSIELANVSGDPSKMPSWSAYFKKTDGFFLGKTIFKKFLDCQIYGCNISFIT